MTFKPMLAASADGVDFRFPLLASPKLDGVRAMVVGGVLMSRTLKPIPNRAVQALFGRPELEGLDGELIVGPPEAPDAYNKTTSVVMSHDKPADQVFFHVFDDFTTPGPFRDRVAAAGRRAMGAVSNVLPVHHMVVTDEEALATIEERAVLAGFEGVMIRDPQGPYKHGRSTAREGWLLKLKRFEDAEAVIVDVVEEMHNTNEAKKNALGRTERSTAKAGKVGKGTLGALVVQLLDDPSVRFEIGSGFDAAQRQEFWRWYEQGSLVGKSRTPLIGKVVKFRHQPSGAKDKPRFPVFLGFRDPIDMGEAA